MKRRLWLLLLLAACARPRPPPAPPGINRQIEPVFQRLISDHAFDRLVPPGWAGDKFSFKSDRIELTFLTSRGEGRSITLFLQPTPGEAGAGPHFHYVPGAEVSAPDERSALLAVARLVDAATPSEALISEQHARDPAQPVAAPTQDPAALPEAPRFVAFALALLQIAIVVGAIVFGVRFAREER